MAKKMTPKDRYAVCIRCGHGATWLQHLALRFAMDCPVCGREKQFGPGVYIKSFKGYTHDEILRLRAANARRLP